MAEQQSTSRRDLEAQIIERALKDDGFRQSLVEDPKGVMARELKLNVPDSITVTVLEETPNSIYLVVPPKPAGSRRELSDSELEAVAGGDSFMCTWDEMCMMGPTSNPYECG